MAENVHIDTVADVRIFGDGERPRLHIAIAGRSKQEFVINRSRRRQRPAIDVLSAAFGLNHEISDDLELLQGVMMLAVGWCKLDSTGENLVGIGPKLARWEVTVGALKCTPHDTAVHFLRNACDLEALMEAIDQASIEAIPRRLVRTVSIDLIDLDEKNFRDDLGGLDDFSKDIRRNGSMHPITVIPKRGGRFDVLLGERRYLAQRNAGYQAIDVIIDSPSPDMVTLLRLSENCQSKKNDHLELAKAYDMALQEKRAISPDFCQKDLADAVQLSVTQMSKYLKLLSIPLEHHDRIRHLGMEQLLLIAGADCEANRQRLIDLALRGATVAKMRSARKTPTKTVVGGFRHKAAHGAISVVLTSKKDAPTKEDVEKVFQSILQDMFPEG